ncbi:MAG TPA: ornithine cyclodeaminase family protein [Vicinamibacteria bacterium]|nr:ornithine cyclodeaminase family protein [Vicinamibacteria bacterium]
MTRYFREGEVAELLPMKDAVAAVEQAFIQLGEGRAVNRPRSRARAGRRTLHVMSAASEAFGYVGLKAYTTGPDGARFYVMLFAAETGELVSLMEGDTLGQIRTGAASGVATRYMARADADTVGIFGTGWQARSQLDALAVVRSLRSVVAYSREEQKRARFCDEMSSRLGIPVTPAERPEDVTAEVHIVVTATSAKEPVLCGSWLVPGQHVNAIGGNALGRREIDEEVVTRSSFIAADSVEQARIECGDLAAVVDAGKLRWEDVHDLADVVTGKKVARGGASEITLFESQGVALEDVAVAKLIYERGVSLGLGKDLEI